MSEDQERQAIMARIMKLIGHRFKPIGGGASLFIYKPGDPHDEAMCAILSRLGTVVFLPDNGRGDAV